MSKQNARHVKLSRWKRSADVYLVEFVSKLKTLKTFHSQNAILKTLVRYFLVSPLFSIKFLIDAVFGTFDVIIWRHWRRLWVIWGPNSIEINFWLYKLVIKPKIPYTVSLNSKDNSSEVLPLFRTLDNQRQNILGFGENEVFWPTSPQNQCCITFFQLK